MPQSVVSARRPSKSNKRRSRALVKLVLQTAFRKKFPSDTVDVSDGYDGNIHIIVVSRAFDKLSERARQATLWRIVENADLTQEEKDLVTLLFGVSPGELK